MSSTCAILASDFSKSTADPTRRDWTIGKMDLLVEVLAGSPVVITTDRGSGHTEIGVRLIRAFDGGPSRGPRVTVERTLSDGDTQQTNYFMWSIGETIVPMEEQPIKGFKWRVLDLYRERSWEAIQAAREIAGHDRGKWEAHPLSAHRWVVRYTPQSTDAPHADYWTIDLKGK
jgi:hypothetical protein